MVKLLTWVGTSFLSQTTPPAPYYYESTLYRYTLHTNAGRQHRPKTSRMATALCPCSGLLWKAAQLTQQKWSTFSNLLCCIFPVTALMILFAEESGSGVWWDHPGCWLKGSCWHSWRLCHKMRTTWHLPDSERNSYKPWITLAKQCSSLMYSIGTNITLGRTSFRCMK